MSGTLSSSGKDRQCWYSMKSRTWPGSLAKPLTLCIEVLTTHGAGVGGESLGAARVIRGVLRLGVTVSHSQSS